jgi:ElaB/YqjD/DUF883 family membrane-anchored ribosome-binding protein
MDPQENLNPLEQLESLLEKQIQLAIKNRYKDVESLTEKANLLLKQIADNKPTEIPNFKEKQNHILELYKKLELILKTEQKLIKDEQQQAGNVRKIINVYHANP